MDVSVISVGVHDMDLALEFYNEKLGVEIKSKQFFPELVELQGPVPLILYKVEKKVEMDYLKDSITTLGFGVRNILETIISLKQKNVEFIYDEPQPFPAGVMTAIKDPSGNIIELLEFRN